MTVKFTATGGLAPGDVRLLGAGDIIVLTPFVYERGDWPSILPALTIAINRGASVIWEEV